MVISSMLEIMYLGFGALFVEIGVAGGPSLSSSVSSPAAFLGVVLRRSGGSFCSGGSDEGAGLGAAAAARLWRAAPGTFRRGYGAHRPGFVGQQTLQKIDGCLAPLDVLGGVCNATHRVRLMESCANTRH